MKYIIGNWKAHKTFQEANEWLNTFQALIEIDTLSLEKLKNNRLSIIFCPPYHFLPLFQNLTQTIPNFHLGVQDVSKHEDGAYTGEITAHSLQGLVEYAIIGHSERRRYFNETNIDIRSKVDQCIKNNIKPILCIRGIEDVIFPEVEMVAYEPQEAIGTGNNAPANTVVELKSQIKILPNMKYIYGGSVNDENMNEYTQQEAIDGVLPGTASLDANEFFRMIQKINM